MENFQQLSNSREQWDFKKINEKMGKKVTKSQ